MTVSRRSFFRWLGLGAGAAALPRVTAAAPMPNPEHVGYWGATIEAGDTIALPLGQMMRVENVAAGPYKRPAVAFEIKGWDKTGELRSFVEANTSGVNARIDTKTEGWSSYNRQPLYSGDRRLSRAGMRPI